MIMNEIDIRILLIIKIYQCIAGLLKEKSVTEVGLIKNLYI